MQQQRQLEIERRLRDIVGERVFVDVAQRVSYGYDGSFGQYLPDFVTQPLATSEVQQIVKLACMIYRFIRGALGRTCRAVRCQ